MSRPRPVSLNGRFRVVGWPGLALNSYRTRHTGKLVSHRLRHHLRRAKFEDQMPPPEPYFAKNRDDLMSLAEIGKISGLDFITGMMEGRYPAPPIARTLDFRLTEVSPGRVVFSGSPKFAHFNPIGTVHGGWFGTLLDSCMACAVQSSLPAGQGYTTLEFKVNILRPAFETSGPLRAIGQADHVGRRTATAFGRMVDQDDKLFATGSTTCLVMPLPQD